MECVRLCGLIAKRWPVVGGVLLVAAVALWVWSPWRAREPVYDGHPISYWLRQFPPTPSWPFKAQTTKGSQALLDDPNAVPFLIRALNGQDASLDKAYLRGWLAAGPVQRFVPEPASPFFRRANGALLLARMGAAARPAIPAIIRALKADENGSVRESAAWALGELGKDDAATVAALGAALTDSVWNVRWCATNALLKIDPESAARAGVKPPAP